MSRKCPDCDTALPLSTPLEINQQVVCPNCGLELEVIWLYPLELAKVISSRESEKGKKDRKKLRKA